MAFAHHAAFKRLGVGQIDRLPLPSVISRLLGRLLQHKRGPSGNAHRMFLSRYTLKPASDELLHLDALRFVAALTVVIYHFRNQALMFGRPLSRLDAFDDLSLAVDLFFVISGIVITFVYSNSLDILLFFQKRIARLAPLHYLTLLFYVLYGLVGTLTGVALAEQWKYNLPCLAPQLVFLQAFDTCPRLSFNHVSWSVSAEMAVYCLFPFVLPVYRRSPAAILAIAAALMIGLWVVGPFGVEQRQWHQLTFDGGVLRAIPGFLFGMSLWGFRSSLGRLPRPRLLLLATTIAFLAGLAFHAPRGAMLLLVYAIAALALASDLRGQIHPAMRRIAPWGALTYGIYMLHPLVRTSLFRPLKALGMSNNIAIAICFMAVVPVAYLCYFAIETPLRRRLSPRLPRRETSV